MRSFLSALTANYHLSLPKNARHGPVKLNHRKILTSAVCRKRMIRINSSACHPLTSWRLSVRPVTKDPGTALTRDMKSMRVAKLRARRSMLACPQTDGASLKTCASAPIGPIRMAPYWGHWPPHILGLVMSRQMQPHSASKPRRGVAPLSPTGHLTGPPALTERCSVGNCPIVGKPNYTAMIS